MVEIAERGAVAASEGRLFERGASRVPFADEVCVVASVALQSLCSRSAKQVMLGGMPAVRLSGPAYMATLSKCTWTGKRPDCTEERVGEHS